MATSTRAENRPYTCAQCGKRKTKVYSYYGSGSGKKLCSESCRGKYIQQKRIEAQERAQKRLDEAQSKPRASQPASQPVAKRSATHRSGFKILGFKLW